MAKKYFYKKEIEIPLYHGTLVIILTNSRKKIKKYCPYFNKNHSAITWLNGKLKTFVAFNFDEFITNGVLHHEITHATNFILSERGVVADFDNDEAQAYLANWVADKIYKFARKKKMKIEYA